VTETNETVPSAASGGRTESPHRDITCPVNVKPPSSLLECVPPFTRSSRLVRRECYPLAGLCVLGAVLRLGLIAALMMHVHSPARLWRSGTEVAAIAVSILNGHGFGSPFSVPTGPTSWVAPIYPLFTVMAFKIWGGYSFASLTSLLALNLLCSTVVTILIYYAGRRYFDMRTAWTATILWTISPYAIGMASKIWDSNLSVLWATVALVLYLQVGKAGSRTRDWVFYGLFWAVAALTSTSLVVLLIPPLVVLGLRDHARMGLRVVVAFTVMSIVVLPWSVRNYVQFHRVIPIRGNFGAELWYGNRPGPRLPGDEYSNPAANAQELRAYVEMGESGYFTSRQRLAMDAIRRDPVRFLKLTLARVAYFWRSDEFPFGWIPFLAFVGVIGLLRQNAFLVAPFVSALLLYPIPYYITHADWNYRYPIVPTLLLPASSGLLMLIGRLAMLVRRRLPSISAEGVIPSSN